MDKQIREWVKNSPSAEIPLVYVDLLKGDYNAAAILSLMIDYSRDSEWFSLRMFVEYAQEIIGAEIPQIWRTCDKLYRLNFVKTQGHSHEQNRVNGEYLLSELHKRWGQE